jgi:hypothetical protein
LKTDDRAFLERLSRRWSDRPLLRAAEALMIAEPSNLIRSSMLALFVFATFDSSLIAGDQWANSCFDVKQLAKHHPDQLEDLFRSGTGDALPLGYAKGRPLLMLDYRNPRMRAAISGLVWKGKHFLADGRMINQWVGVRAVEAVGSVAPSSLDGLPCIRLDYPPDAAVFGNSFDELREIAPGVLLGRFYERCPAPRLKGYFVLTMTPYCQ